MNLAVDDGQVEIRAARGGRPPATARLHDRDDIVRVEVRMRAHVASRLFDLADAERRTVSSTAEDMISSALDRLTAGGTVG